MKKNKKLLAILLSLNMLIFSTSCDKDKGIIDYNSTLEIVSDDLDENEKLIFMKAEDFTNALLNYKLDTSNENRVKLVSETRNLVALAKEMIAYKLNAEKVSYSIEYEGVGAPYVFSVKIDNTIYSNLQKTGPLYTLFNSCDNVDYFVGNGSNREKWTDSVTNEFIHYGIDLYNQILIQSAYDYEINENGIVVSYESENIKQYKKALR